MFERHGSMKTIAGVPRSIRAYLLIKGPPLLGFKNWLGKSEEHTSELQSQSNLVCRLLLETIKNWPSFRCAGHSSSVYAQGSLSTAPAGYPWGRAQPVYLTNVIHSVAATSSPTHLDANAHH